jgi:hypothetical protein
MNGNQAVLHTAQDDTGDSVRSTAALCVSNRTDLWWLLLVVFTTLSLCLPFMRSIFWLADEGILLHGAERLLQGRRLYTDFFEILPPGGFAIVTLWFAITGISVWSARMLAILTITGIASFIYLTCRQTSKNPGSSAFVAIGWVALSQGFWTQINYHWFTTLFSMVAAWAAFASIAKPQQRWEPLIAGLAAGAAAMVVPTRGLLAMLAAVTGFTRQMSKLVAYSLASVAIPILLLLYVMAQGSFSAAFDDLILFTATRYTSVASVPFAYLTEGALKYLFPLVALLTLTTLARDGRTALQDRLFRSCIAFAVAGFIGCFPRPDAPHIAFGVPLICPLLTYCTQRLLASWSRKSLFALAALVISLGIPAIYEFSYFAYTALHGESVATPRGRVTVLNNGTRELMARIATTPSSDRYFFYPYMPMLPFLTAREHVSKYDIFIPGYTTSSQYQEACISALQYATWLVIDRSWTAVTLRRYFPALRDAAPRETTGFESALERAFEFVAREGTFELRRRIDNVNETICVAVAE